MAAIVRYVFPLIAYLCVGTVITLGAGYGYLRASNKLDDERMFRIVSLLHGVDLEEIAEAHENNRGDVPPEELSHDQKERMIQLAILDYQGKKNDLKGLNREFDFQYNRLKVIVSLNENFKDEVAAYLEQRKAEAIDSGIVSVRGQLQNLFAKKQAKPLIKKLVEDERTDAVILLLNGMPPKNRRDILRTFDSEEDLEMLYQIQKQMLAGDPEKSYIENKIQELQQGKQQDR